MRKSALFITLALVLLVTSCAPRVPETPPLKSGYTVAVLPLDNVTNDVGGAQMVRELLYRRMHRYFEVKPEGEVDTLLKDHMGITLGSQLSMTTPEKVGEVLGVDGLVYGYLLDFDDITTGLYNVRKVRAGFKLVDTKTGQVVWARGLGVKSVTGLVEIPSAAGVALKEAADIPGINDWQTMARVTFDELRPQKSEELIAVGAIEAALTVLSLGLHAGGVILGVHMRTESSLMVDRITETVPLEATVAPPPKKAEVPRLIFPAFSVYEGRDFTAIVSVTTVSSAGEKVTKRIRLSKLADSILSSDGITTIIKKDLEKGYILYPSEKRYIEAGLEGAFLETAIIKEPEGEEAVDGHPCLKSRVTVKYPDGSELKGHIWEAKDLGGFAVKAETGDGPEATSIEVSDVELKAPPSAIFEIPEGYTRTED